MSNPEQILDEFLRTASIRQLGLLREMAGGMKMELVKEKDIPKPEGKVDVITEVVKPPTEQ